LRTSATVLLVAAAVPLLSGLAGASERKATRRASCAEEPVLQRRGLRDWSTSARIAFELRDGQGVGFRFFAVRPDSPLAGIGIQDGDVVTRIAGVDVTSPDRMPEVYARLSSRGCASMTVERQGEPIELSFNLR
jgi:S1-C subfamily serine protease